MAAGPMSHPIRPESYISMDNFYTATGETFLFLTFYCVHDLVMICLSRFASVYSKGAEVVRMYKTLLGEEGFRKGMDLYFKRLVEGVHDLISSDRIAYCNSYFSYLVDMMGMLSHVMTSWQQWQMPMELI